MSVSGITIDHSGRVRSATIERDRLRQLLSGYDVCECGWHRNRHNGGSGCDNFRCSRPADPLETILDDGRTLSEMVGEAKP